MEFENRHFKENLQWSGMLKFKNNQEKYQSFS